jgi:hypothetical protein
MSDVAPQHSSAAEVEQALFALGDGSHPFEVVRNGDRIEAVWRHRLRGPGLVFGSAEWRYRVTLLDESGEYKASVLAKNFDSGNDYFGFKSTDVTRPVKETLERHGWQKHRGAIGKAFGKLFGRDD